MSKIYFLVLILVVMLQSCDDGEEKFLEEFSYKDPAVGQEARYSLFIGQKYYDQEDSESYEYPGFTLVSKIISRDENGFKVREYVSLDKDADGSKYPHKDSVYTYYLDVIGDSIRIYNLDGLLVSHLFGTFDELKLSLEDFTENKMEIMGWKVIPLPPELNSQGYLESFRILDRNYKHANVIVRNENMAVDGPGFTFIYNPGLGMIRYYVVNPWLSSGIGWDRL